jgi:hypothetical protein
MIPIPAQGSLSTESAFAWLNQLDDLSSMINKNGSLQEQAMQAVQLKNDLVDAMRNAMADANAAANMGIVFPARTYDGIAKDLSAARQRTRKPMTRTSSIKPSLMKPKRN